MAPYPNVPTDLDSLARQAAFRKLEIKCERCRKVAEMGQLSIFVKDACDLRNPGGRMKWLSGGNSRKPAPPPR